jgi:hypothetical protein
MRHRRHRSLEVATWALALYRLATTQAMCQSLTKFGPFDFQPSDSRALLQIADSPSRRPRHSSPSSPAATPEQNAQANAARSRIASAVAGPLGPMQFNRGIGYIAPAGWRVTTTNGAVEMDGPVGTPGAVCTALLLPPIPAQRDLASQAEGLVNQMLAARFGGPFHAEYGSDVKRDRYGHYEGVSGAGWPFVDLYGKVGGFSGGALVHVLLAQMGSQVVPLVGVSRNSYQCMGGHDNITWMVLFFSLQLPGFTGDSPILRKELIGSWTAVGSSVYVNNAYAANGHFSANSAHATYKESGRPGLLLQETSDWLGDGTYQVNGDLLTTIASRGADAGKPKRSLFNIARRPAPEKPGGFEHVLRRIQTLWNQSGVTTMTKDW